MPNGLEALPQQMLAPLTKIFAMPFNLPFAMGSALIEGQQAIAMGRDPFQVTAKTIEAAFQLPQAFMPQMPGMQAAPTPQPMVAGGGGEMPYPAQPIRGKEIKTSIY